MSLFFKIFLSSPQEGYLLSLFEENILMLVKDIAAQLNAEFIGDGLVDIEKVANLKTAQPGQISFLSDIKYRDVLDETQASCVMVKKEFAEHVKGSAIILDDPYLGFAKVAQMLDTTPAIATNIHPSAYVAEGVTLGNNVALGPNVVIESGDCTKQLAPIWQSW